MPTNTANQLPACSFGNRVMDGLSAALVAASGSGPGPVSAAIGVAANECLAVTFLARKAGAYSLSVLSVASGEPLPGSPLQVRRACRCSAARNSNCCSH